MGRTNLSRFFHDVEGQFFVAEYREREGYRFAHDSKAHHHDALAAPLKPSPQAFPLRHWTIQDIFDSAHVEETLVRAAQYGMTGIQFSGDNIYWANDSFERYNTYVFAGRLCERCHDLGLQAFFWVHEINGFFHAFVKDGEYGFSNQLVGGRIDLRSDSGYWDVLRDKYDVFFSRLKGIDGIVLTLNESQVPVFRDEVVESDLDAAARVARIGGIVREVCEAHDRRLILRTFCYDPEELENIRRGVEAIGGDVPVMVKCQPHDWHTFYPHNPLIEALRDHPVVVEFDLAHEPMGASQLPYPDTDYLKYRFDHIAWCGALGAAGRIDRFRNHAAGTLNWSNVYAFSRLCHRPGTDADTIWREYAAADFGEANAEFVTSLGRRLFEAGKVTFFNAKEWGSQHTNLLRFQKLEHGTRWSRSLWDPEDEEARETLRLLGDPTPAFIEDVCREKDEALADIDTLREEVEARRASFDPDDAAYLAAMLKRVRMVAEALMSQHKVMLMVRHDASRPPAERRYGEAVASLLARLRTLASEHAEALLDGGNEGNQIGPEMLEVFCRNAERHLNTAPAS